ASADGQYVAALGQPLDHIAPDEPGPAEDRRSMLFHPRSKEARPHYQKRRSTAISSACTTARELPTEPSLRQAPPSRRLRDGPLRPPQAREGYSPPPPPAGEGWGGGCQRGRTDERRGAHARRRV